MHVHASGLCVGTSSIIARSHDARIYESPQAVRLGHHYLCFTFSSHEQSSRPDLSQEIRALTEPEVWRSSKAPENWQ